MRPPVNAADGAAVAIIAGNLRAFPVRIHGGDPGENAPAHFTQQSFHAVEQGKEFLRLDQVGGAPVWSAFVGQRVIELAAVLRRRFAIELAEGIEAESPGVAVSPLARRADTGQNLAPVDARLVT